MGALPEAEVYYTLRIAIILTFGAAAIALLALHLLPPGYDTELSLIRPVPAAAVPVHDAGDD